MRPGCGRVSGRWVRSGDRPTTRLWPGLSVVDGSPDPSTSVSRLWPGLWTVGAVGDRPPQRGWVGQDLGCGRVSRPVHLGVPVVAGSLDGGCGQETAPQRGWVGQDRPTTWARLWTGLPTRPPCRPKVPGRWVRTGVRPTTWAPCDRRSPDGGCGRETAPQRGPTEGLWTVGADRSPPHNVGGWARTAQQLGCGRVSRPVHLADRRSPDGGCGQETAPQRGWVGQDRPTTWAVISRPVSFAGLGPKTREQNAIFTLLGEHSQKTSYRIEKQLLAKNFDMPI